jgi:hypothetical protein
MDSQSFSDMAFDAEPEPEPKGKRPPPQRDRVIDVVLSAGAVFWRDADSVAFATIPGNDGQTQRYKVRSSAFKLAVRAIYATACPVKSSNGNRPGSISDTAMRETIPAFEALACGGATKAPDVRCLRDESGVWIDLGDDSWRAVHITAAGWKVVELTEAPLIRPEGMRALPTPERMPGGTMLAELRRLLNLQSDDDLRLVVAWLLSALYPAGPYAVLAVDGEQGSGKSTTCRMLRRLVDPNQADLRTMARNEDDIIIAATNGRIVAFDNVSFIQPETADALCRVATGAGLSKRRLYSDGEECIFSVCRPVLLNGIPSLLARGDLADRSIAITLPAIPDAARRRESEIWTQFNRVAPGILAGLLDGLKIALQNLPTLKLKRLLRMADFTALACAAAPAFDWTADDMIETLERNRAAAIETIVEADAVAEAVLAVASEHPAGWTGTASELLQAINSHTPESIQREKAWPKDAARLSARLKRAAPALRRLGIEIEHHRNTARRGITITKEAASYGSSPQRDSPSGGNNININGIAESAYAATDGGEGNRHDAMTMNDSYDDQNLGVYDNSPTPATVGRFGRMPGAQPASLQPNVDYQIMLGDWCEICGGKAWWRAGWPRHWFECKTCRPPAPGQPIFNQVGVRTDAH